MKRFGLIAAAAVVGATAAGAACAGDFIQYTVTGTLTPNGGDSQMLAGATIVGEAHYDLSQVYVDRFGFAAIPAIFGSPSVTISGSGNGSNNTTVAYTTDLAFYPTFAGTFTEPTGLHTEFVSGSGALFQWQMNTTPSAGSGNVVVGGLPELDDFVPANWGGGLLVNLGTSESYTLSNVVIHAVIVPAPGAVALLGVAGLLGSRRRRR